MTAPETPTSDEAQSITLARDGVSVVVKVGDVVPFIDADQLVGKVVGIETFPVPDGTVHQEIAVDWDCHAWWYDQSGSLIGLEDIRPIDLAALASRPAAPDVAGLVVALLKHNSITTDPDWPLGFRLNFNNATDRIAALDALYEAKRADALEARLKGGRDG